MGRMKTVPAGLLAFAALAHVSAASAAEWVIDKSKSTLGFTGSQSGAAFNGRFADWQAQIVFDPANPGAGHALVTIDMASAATGDRQKDEALPQAEWFDAKSFPQARFEATSFRAKGGNAYEAVGTLSIRNTRKDVVLPFTLEVQNNQAHAKGRLELIRTDYGVGQGPWSSGQMVALDVAVVLDITATAKP